jgi:hypothetical protein
VSPVQKATQLLKFTHEHDLEFTESDIEDPFFRQLSTELAATFGELQEVQVEGASGFNQVRLDEYLACY